ncbi:MAG: hypothetical protein FJX47_08515 [Alphaproteobacteria bacterium]|nr:hypothetical protein [Alphaproteobacteria bacterium]
MSDAEALPAVEPAPERMLRHLEHLYGGFLDGCQNGRIELAWTDGKNGRLKHAAVFGTDELDLLVERAAAENRKPGQNVYVGAALRKPDVPPFGRCNDEDFLALTAFYADLDDEGAAAKAKTLYRGCPPTAVVVTGRHPHVRAQLLWRQETPERDPDLCRRQNLALAEALGGDRTVVNPSRVLRLGGSVAWPTKPGRVIERTEFVEFDDGRPRMYLPGQIARAFPPAQSSLAPASPSPDQSPTPVSPAPSAATLNIGSGFDGVSVEACLARVRAGDRWHDNLVRLTGHWIARGWSDAEILAAGSSLTLPGWTVAQTVREVTAMIAGGRTKWNVPNPAHRVEEVSAVVPLQPAFLDSLNLAMLPRRRWLLGRSLLRGHLTLLVAPPGVGKSTHGIARAVAVATGRDITGEAVHEQTRTWVYNTEDDADELKRRLGAVLQHWSIPFAEVKGRVALNSGADRPLLFARADRNGMAIRLPDVDACIARIREHGIGLFIGDPFVETHELNENSNEQIKAVAVMFREVARAANCAVLLVHHTAKPPQGASDGHAGNMNTARGASALVGVARVVQTLFAMSEKDAERHGVAKEERHRYLRLDDAKANLGLTSPEARWFRKAGVELPNGDEVGVLIPEDLGQPAPEKEKPGASDLRHTIVAVLLARTAAAEITVNAAARLLAWSDDERFHRYRQTDDQGHQRAKRSLRDAVREAAEAGIAVISGGKSHGFTCDTSVTPAILRRFETPVAPADLAAQKPDFTEEDDL